MTQIVKFFCEHIFFLQQLFYNELEPTKKTSTPGGSTALIEKASKQIHCPGDIKLK